MDLQSDLKWIHQELDEVKDPVFIEAIKNMLRYRKKNSSERISLEQYNKELEESITDIQNGNTHSHEAVKEAIELWKKR